MVEKKDVIEGWPLETGDYDVGDIQCPVAVVTLGSKMNADVVQRGAAIAGPLHTENLGIEKVVANVISNSNIRFVIVCGSEVQGHITGKTMEALYENGIDPEKKVILGSPGAIPFVENLSVEAVERFQDQITLISMINNENLDEIEEKISECIANDPGAYPQDAMIVELNDVKDEEDDEQITEDDEEFDGVGVDSSIVMLEHVESRIRYLKGQINEIAAIERFSSGYYAGRMEGIVIGFCLTIILTLILLFKGLLVL
ncbi:tetrahydromethanopterin S-methyltransferase subunit A [Methanosphaera sp. BMS]|uniref:tetrahydromethanopterin S-methyltransferase subunit A n=1 Tax=Methanosphaera sp. BMS TaxID=1789762 RepID=UPI000DC1C9B5|nr:tetrahydromethanopterin S-methyltransferase subunit A [Methanosphaera sp. BMS]AWX32608.1 tetrahydromethanopterin S-methyltransferase subunit A [Methanosphaera sp. BMS]